MARQFVAASSEFLSVDIAVLTATPLTTSAWFWPDSTSQSTLIHITDASQPTQAFGLQWSSSKCRFHTSASGFVSASSGNTGTVGAWNHFLGSSSSSTNREAELNGDVGNKGTNSTDATPTGIDRTAIGMSRDSSPSSPADGRVAEVGIWNVFLSVAEKAMLALGFSPLFVRPESLVFYMPLIRDDDNDLVGGLHLTAGGTPTVAEHTRIIRPSAQILQFPSVAAVSGGVIQSLAHRGGLAGASGLAGRGGGIAG